MDKYILLIETATDACSVALAKNSETIAGITWLFSLLSNE